MSKKKKIRGTAFEEEGSDSLLTDFMIYLKRDPDGKAVDHLRQCKRRPKGKERNEHRNY